MNVPTNACGLARRLTATLGCVLAATLALALGACSTGPSDEELIRQGLSAELDQLVNKSGDEYDEIMSDVESSYASMLGDYGIDPVELAESIFDGFGYTIDAVEVDGDTATASVTLTMKSMTDFMEKVEAASQEFVEGADLATMTQDEAYAKIGEIIMESIDSAEHTEIPVEVGLTRDSDGAWTEDGNVAQEVADAVASS